MWPVIVEILRALERSQNGERRRAEKYDFQHRVNEQLMARWTRHVGLFTGALVVVGVITAVIFWRQLNDMQSQLDEMKVDRRPWVSVDAFIGGITWDTEGAHVLIKF